MERLSQFLFSLVAAQRSDTTSVTDSPPLLSDVCDVRDELPHKQTATSTAAVRNNNNNNNNCDCRVDDANDDGRDESTASLLDVVACRALRAAGVVPRHVALILDGNRRFARKCGLQRSEEGHALGFDKLHQVLEWCFEAGVKAVTIYAFSIENFRRPAAEVNALMDLAQRKFSYLLERSAVLRRYGVRVSIWGDKSLLSPELRRVIEKLESGTAGRNGPALNVCFPYTSTHEVVHAANELAKQSFVSFVDSSAFERALFSAGDHPDLVIRTSGECRLSDFLCYQSSQSAFFCVYDCLWPEFGRSNFFAAVIWYAVQKMELK